ncbi:MAG: Ribonuclease J 1 [Deltaproteobacteria bacterium ADurb.Bin510]|nr:MAG: Ribonuclease J 1 [Deltaproteobacteria bacterium ADurb.Bin510]
MSFVDIIPLGGVREFGLNCLALQTGAGAILIDAGLMFPRYNITGIDQIIPDFGYVVANQAKFKGVLLTHGHEDHLGALPHLLKQARLPVYGHAFALEILRRKLWEQEIDTRGLLHPIEHGARLELAGLGIEAIEVEHSTLGCFTYRIESPQGLIVHSGDFRKTPVAYAAFSEPARVFICESTNAENAFEARPESEVIASIEAIVKQTTGTVLVSTFSSHMARIQGLYEVAVRNGRRVAIIGRSLNQAVDIASDLGLIKLEPEHLLNPEQLNVTERSKVMIVCTGTQGEMYSVLALIARGWHNFKAREGDSVIISARIIPGNEFAISRCIDQLIDVGAEVYYPGVAEVHTSGHATQAEVVKALEWLRPAIVLPVHGELRHMKALKNLALETLAQPPQCELMRAGQVWRLDEKGLNLSGEVSHGKCFVDGHLTGDLKDEVLKDRRHISEGGMVVAFVVIDTHTREIVLGPDVFSTGVVPGEIEQSLMEELGQAATQLLNQAQLRESENAVIGERLKETMSRLLKARIGKKPLVKPIIMEI